MNYSLSLFGRPTGPEPFLEDLTPIAQGWRHASRAVGGYWHGEFRATRDRWSQNAMTDFYNQRLGSVIREKTAGGLLSWEGYIAEMRLVQNGIEHMRSLTAQTWHNKVAIYYTWPRTEDSEQGNLVYDVDPPNDSFQDDAQDFTDWETTGGSDSRYRIKVLNDDDTVGWAFLGEAFTETNPEDAVYCFEDIERTEEGWCGTHQGKTPVSYVVERVDLAGEHQNTGWAEDSDSIEEYGQMEYIDSPGSITGEVATFLQARHLTEFAWPRSWMVGGTATGGAPVADTLVVLCLGFWHTMNWRHRTSAGLAPISPLLGTLVAETEFVTAGRIETNLMAGTVDAAAVPQRLGDVVGAQIELGDESGNVWQGGVYADRALRYEQAPQVVEYFLRDGRLTNKHGILVHPLLLEPGFLLRAADVMLAGQPPGATGVWNDPAVAYVNQVEFIAPNLLRLSLFGQEESVLTLHRQFEGAS